jgi:hypothetical protein
VELLPADVLVNFWSEISKRKAVELNAHNHTGAIAVAISQAEKEKSTHLDYRKWLPYSLGDSKDSSLSISRELIAELVRMRDQNELPPAMIRDLYKFKVIAPGDKNG